MEGIMRPRKIRILIIDDEKDFCYFIKKNLELFGNYRVLIAIRGRKGIWMAKWHKPDLILLDILMPFLDGFGVLRRIKQSPKTLDIPVIMLTAKGDEEFKIKASSLYNEDYLVKPVEIGILKSKIEAILSKFNRPL